MPELLTREGTRVYYETTSDVGEPLVLIHGLGSSGQLWQPQVADLKNHYRVITLDFPGHGRSGKADAYSIEQLVDVLEDVMDHCGIEKAHLMGLSLGCAVALTYATRFPERVLSLVLQGPVGGLVPRTHPGWCVKIALLRAYLLFLYLLSCIASREAAIHWVNCYGFQTYGVYQFLESIQCRAQPKAIWQLAQALAYPPYIGKLHQVACPLLLVVGAGDVTPKRYWQYIMENVSGATQYVIVPRARHIVSIEQSSHYNQLVLQFLGDLKRAHTFGVSKSQAARQPVKTRGVLFPAGAQ